MKRLLGVLFLILLIGLVFGEDLNTAPLSCQYTIDSPFQKEVQNLYSKATDEKLIFKPLYYDNLIQNGDYTTDFTFEVHNDNDYAVKYEVTYKRNTPGGLYETKEVYDVKARDYNVIQTGICGACYRSGHVFLRDSVEFKLLENKVYSLRYENETIHDYNCAKCNGVDCLDDGQSCSNSIQCGGKFCVMGICNSENKFWNNIIPCKSNEVACNENTCIEKASVGLGLKPTCSNQECIYGTTDENGLCVKTISLLQAERIAQEGEATKLFFQNLQFWITAFVILVLIVVAGYYYVKRERTKEIKARTEEIIQKQKLISKEIEKRQHEIDNLHEEISQIKSKKELKEREIQKLSELETEFNQKKTNLLSYMGKEWERINQPFPYELASNRLVIINPYLGGYYCFYQDGTELKDYPLSSLVHIWIWKNANGRSPKQGHHIHHIDGNKYNNDPSNLDEIEGSKHYGMHRRY